jgi:hypothetical protein
MLKRIRITGEKRVTPKDPPGQLKVHIHLQAVHWHEQFKLKVS